MPYLPVASLKASSVWPVASTAASTAPRAPSESPRRHSLAAASPADRQSTPNSSSLPTMEAVVPS